MSAFGGCGATMRVLIVDDHDVVRRGLRDLLASNGWDVCAEATSGEEAVARAEACRPDVAIVDAMMPGVDGLAATRRIRERAPGTEVVVFTMNEAEEVVVDALAAGARGYVLKTDPLRYLLAAVEAVASHATFVTPTLSEVPGFAARHHGRGPRHAGPLTPREREIVRLLAGGSGSKQIAETLAISVKTVETHRANVMRKLQLGTLVDLVRYAVRNHLVEA